MIAVHEKRPRGAGTPGAAGNLEARQSYPSRAELQGPGEQFAQRWVDAADRFISAFFRALTDPPIPAISRVIEAARDDAPLTPSDFPTSEHWNLCALLSAFSERGMTPTPARILEAAQLAGMELPLGGGDQHAELDSILRRECSAAGLRSWARELREHGRKAAQVARLWRVLRDRIVDDAGAAAPSATPVQEATRFSRGAIARVMRDL